MIPVCNHGRQLVSTERTIYWRSHDCHLDNLLEKSRTTERRSQTTDRPRRRCKSAEALGQSGRSLQFNVQRHAGTMRQNWTVLQTTTTTKTHSGVFFVHIITCTRRTQHKRPREHCEILLNSRDLPASQFCQLLYMKSLWAATHSAIS